MDLRTALLVASAIVLVLVPGLAAGAMQDHRVTGEPSFEVSVPDNRLTPGETTALEIVLYNDGNLTQGSRSNPDLEAEVQTARALRANVSDEGMPFTVETNEQFVTRFPQGTSTRLPFQISVDADAPPGTYTVPVGIKYNYTDIVNARTGERNVTSQSRLIDVNVTVEDTAQFKVVDVDSNTRVGATGTVAVTLKNTGSERARNATVSLTSGNADLTFAGTSSASRYAGTAWFPGETRTVEYRVTTAESAATQRYTFTAQVAFEDEQGIESRSEALSLGVVPGPEQEFSIVGVESDLAVDDEAPLRVTLRNEGPLAVDEAGVTITSASGDVVFGESASARQFLGRWRANTTRTVQVEATATPDAEPRNYSLDATVTYEDREGDPGTSGPLQFGLSPAPERNPEFSVGDVSSTLRVGREGVLRGTVTNEGGEPARDAVVVFEGGTRNVEPLEREYSVGRLRAGQSAEFAFDIEVSDAAGAGPRRFTVHVEYRDEDGDARVSDSFDIRERVGQKRDTFAVATRNASIPKGGSRTVRVAVRNDEDETLTDISAQVFADDPIDVDDSEAFIPRLEPGESTTISFEVSAAQSALTRKDYRLEMDFQYDDADGDTLLSDTYSIPVSVRESESGGGPPVVLIGVAVVVAVVAVLGYRRYGE